MAVYTASVPAATAVVGFDLLTNQPQLRQSGAARALESVAVTGSAAAGDSEVSVRIGNVEVARLHNSATGFPTQDASRVNLGGAYIPPGEPLSVIVLDAPATNPLQAQLDVTEL